MDSDERHGGLEAAPQNEEPAEAAPEKGDLEGVFALSEAAKKQMADGRLAVVEDVVKNVLKWLVVSVCGFAYWLAMLLLLSLFLNSVWIVRFEQLLNYSIVLAAITSVGYAGVLIYRKFGNR